MPHSRAQPSFSRVSSFQPWREMLFPFTRMTYSLSVFGAAAAASAAGTKLSRSAFSGTTSIAFSSRAVGRCRRRSGTRPGFPLSQAPHPG